MIRRIFSFIFISAIISSCGNVGKKEASSKIRGSEADAKIEFASLVANPDNYIGKTISVEGKVVHVCAETGKKMFIAGENPDVRLYIAAGENISKFPMELVNNDVIVEGLITKASEADMTADEKQMEEMKGMEAKNCCDRGGKTMSGDCCKSETAAAGKSSLANIIMEYKSHTIKQ